MKLVIGIISYLVDNQEQRNHRIKKLDELINKCNQLFNLPIHIIAQNYRDDEIEYYTTEKNVTLDFYNRPLGITGARKRLRTWFLNSDYTNIIMLDDDCEIKGTVNDAQLYLKQIQENSDCFIEFNLTLLKLFEISKDIFKDVDFPNIEAEREEGFEDRIFVNELRIKYPDKRRTFTHYGLSEHSIATKDKRSTWYKNQNLTIMNNRTKNMIDKLC